MPNIANTVIYFSEHCVVDAPRRATSFVPKKLGDVCCLIKTRNIRNASD